MTHEPQSKRVIALLSLVLGSAFFNLAHAQDIVITNSGIAGIVLSDPKSAPFINAGSRASIAMQEAFPFSIAITNMTNEVLAGVAVSFGTTSQTGAQSRRTVMKVFSKLAGGPGLRPGAAAIVTPICVLTPSLSRACPTELPKVEATLARLKSAKRLDIAVDAVLWQSGRFAGPNKTFFFEHVAADLSADMLVASEVTELHGSGKTNAEISQWLNAARLSGPFWG